MFNPFPFIFVILELKFFLTVAHWGHEAKHKFLKKMLHIRDNVAHWGVAHWVHPVYIGILYCQCDKVMFGAVQDILIAEGNVQMSLIENGTVS